MRVVNQTGRNGRRFSSSAASAQWPLESITQCWTAAYYIRRGPPLGLCQTHACVHWSIWLRGRCRGVLHAWSMEIAFIVVFVFTRVEKSTSRKWAPFTLNRGARKQTRALRLHPHNLIHCRSTRVCTHKQTHTHARTHVHAAHASVPQGVSVLWMKFYADLERNYVSACRGEITLHLPRCACLPTKSSPLFELEYSSSFHS